MDYYLELAYKAASEFESGNSHFSINKKKNVSSRKEKSSIAWIL